MLTKLKNGLDGTQLKTIALVLMVLDHIHYFFEFTGCIPTVFSMLGRLSAPLFLFCTVEGFAHTHDRRRYFIRIWGIGTAMAALEFFMIYAKAFRRGDGFYPLNAIFQELMLLLSVMDAPPVTQSAYQAEQIALIRRIHDQMMSDMSQRCTIEMLSQQYHINTSTLKSLFKTVYGQPLAAHMKEHRMEYAARLLRTTTDSLAEIAEKVGYESQSKLTAAFKSAYGVLPSEYRKEKKESSRP